MNNIIRTHIINITIIIMKMTVHLDIGAKPDGQVGEPDDTGCVARKPNELRLVEIFRNISDDEFCDEGNTQEYCAIRLSENENVVHRVIRKLVLQEHLVRGDNNC